MSLEPLPPSHGSTGRAALGIPAPPAGPGVCRRCHGPTVHGEECWCCRAVGRLLGQACGTGLRSVPLALCRPGDELHGALRRYKDSPALSARRHYAALLARLLQGFLLRHRPCLETAAGGWDALAVVPSSGRSPKTGSAPGPFNTVVGQVPALGAWPSLVLRRGPGRAGHMAADPSAFRLDDGADGDGAAISRPRRVLLLDDTWVTGARARSAAAALEEAGMVVVAVVVCGRSVDPAAAPRLGRWWAEQTVAGVGRPGRCCADRCRAWAGSDSAAVRLWSNAQAAC